MLVKLYKHNNENQDITFSPIYDTTYVTQIVEVSPDYLKSLVYVSDLDDVARRLWFEVTNKVYRKLLDQWIDVLKTKSKDLEQELSGNTSGLKGEENG